MITIIKYYFFEIKFFKSSRNNFLICLYRMFSTSLLLQPPFILAAISVSELYSPSINFSMMYCSLWSQKNLVFPFSGEFRGDGYGCDLLKGKGSDGGYLHFADRLIFNNSGRFSSASFLLSLFFFFSFLLIFFFFFFCFFYIIFAADKRIISIKVCKEK